MESGDRVERVKEEMTGGEEKGKLFKTGPVRKPMVSTAYTVVSRKYDPPHA